MWLCVAFLSVGGVHACAAGNRFRSRQRRRLRAACPASKRAIVHGAWLAAGIRNGMARASARSSVSTMRCEVFTFPPATAAGSRAFTIVPSGRSHDRPHQPRGSGHLFVQRQRTHKTQRLRDSRDRVDAAPRIAARSPWKVHFRFAPAIRIVTAIRCGSPVMPSSPGIFGAIDAFRNFRKRGCHHFRRVIEEVTPVGEDFNLRILPPWPIRRRSPIRHGSQTSMPPVRSWQRRRVRREYHDMYPATWHARSHARMSKPPDRFAHAGSENAA